MYCGLVKYINNEEHYALLMEQIDKVKHTLWIGTADFNDRAITNRRLRRRDGCLLLTIITRTRREHSCCDADTKPLLTHCVPLTRFSTTFFYGCGST